MCRPEWRGPGRSIYSVNKGKGTASAAYPEPHFRISCPKMHRAVCQCYQLDIVQAVIRIALQKS